MRRLPLNPGWAAFYGAVAVLTLGVLAVTVLHSVVAGVAGYVCGAVATALAFGPGRERGDTVRILLWPIVQAGLLVAIGGTLWLFVVLVRADERGER